jgi:hypothetical protein
MLLAAFRYLLLQQIAHVLRLRYYDAGQGCLALDVDMLILRLGHKIYAHCDSISRLVLRVALALQDAAALVVAQ